MKEYLTDAGRNMLAGMLAGEYTIRYTKIQMGDGRLSTSQYYKKMTELINPITSLDIHSVVVTADNIVKIAAIFSNENLTSGFYYREKGIFATDGKNEILFAYANSGSDAEWIEPPTVELVEKKIVSLYKEYQDTETELDIKVKSGIYLATDDAAEMYATKDEMEEKVSKGDIINNLTTTITGKALDAAQGKVLKKLITDIVEELSKYLPLTGGELTGRLEIPANWTGGGLHINALSGDGICIWGDNEGGNIRIYSPASLETPRYYEIDAYSGGLRVYTTPVDTWSMTVPLQIKPDGIQVSTINGKKINTADTTVFNGIPVIMGDGVMEIGRYLDFHYNNDTPSTTDKSARVSVNTNGELETSGSFVANGSLVATREVILGNGEYLHTVTGGNGNGIKFTFFTNPLFQILPEVDNVAALGHSSYRFAEVRAVNIYMSSGTAVTSDRRYKNTEELLDDELMLDFVMSLKPKSFKYNDGDSGRKHYGLIAQDVEKAMQENNINSQDFAGLIIENLTEPEEYEEKNEEGEIEKKQRLVETGETKYDLRYEEFIALLISVIQQQQRRLDEVSSKLKKMESMIYKSDV